MPDKQKVSKPQRMARQQVTILRAQGKLIPENSKKEVACRVTIQDINELGMGLFVENASLSPGTSVTMQFESPSPLKVKARLVWARAVNHNARIIRAGHFEIRVGTEFVDVTDEQKKQLRAFIQALRDPYFSKSAQSAEGDKASAQPKIEKASDQAAEPSAEQGHEEGDEGANEKASGEN